MAILKCALIAFFCLSFTHARNPPAARNLEESRENGSPIPRKFNEAKSANGMKIGPSSLTGGYETVAPPRKSDKADETKDNKVGPSIGLTVGSGYGSVTETGDGTGVGIGIGGGSDYCGYPGCRPYEDCRHPGCRPYEACTPHQIGVCNPTYDPYCWPYKGVPHVSGEHQDNPAMGTEVTDPPAELKKPDGEGQVGSQN